MLEGTGDPLSERLQAQASSAQLTAVDVEDYRADEVRLGVQSPGPGLLVLKDIYAPGWQAQIDGQPTRVLRVDGLVRGVAIAQAGQHEIVFQYQPQSFVRGVWLAIATAAVLVASLVAAYLEQRRRGRGHASEALGCSARPA
jgi:uncharacterized membrane protein YfhO